MDFNPSRRLFLRTSALASVAPIIVPPVMGPLEKVVKYFFAPSGGWGVTHGNMLLTPTIITRECLKILQKNLVFIDSISLKYDDIFDTPKNHRIGDALTVRIPRWYDVS